MPRRSLAAAGFTLLELLVAISIFITMMTAILVFMDSSDVKVAGSLRARELRVLAEWKLGEVEIFEREFDDIFDDEDFDEYGDRWDGWTWSLGIRDVVIFGTTSDENAEYLFGAPDEDDEEQDQDAGGAPAEREGETQFLRELTLTVKAPDDGAGENDSVTIVTFLPLVDYGVAAPGGAGAPGPGSGGN